jgi:hypothetical protein
MSTGAGQYYCFFCNGRSRHTRVCNDCSHSSVYEEYDGPLYRYDARKAPDAPVDKHVAEWAEQCAQSDLKLAIRRARNGAVRVTP